MSRFLIKLFVLLTLLGLFGAAGCGGGGLPARQAGGPQEQGQEQAREQAPAPPGSSRTAEPGIRTGKTKGPDPRPFVHQFMSCRLLEPFGQQAYAIFSSCCFSGFPAFSRPLKLAPSATMIYLPRLARPRRFCCSWERWSAFCGRFSTRSLETGSAAAGAGERGSAA